MTWFIVDVESDGPCPALYSMVSFGAVKLGRELKPTFYGRTAPLAGALCDPAALAVSGVTRVEHESFPDPKQTMRSFAEWVKENTDPNTPAVFVSDNPAFDWQFINYYFHAFCGENPFGFSARRIGDIYSGLMKDVRRASEWKRYRVTPHTHDPVDDAKGNAEAILAMSDHLDLKLPTLF